MINGEVERRRIGSGKVREGCDEELKRESGDVW